MCNTRLKFRWNMVILCNPAPVSCSSFDCAMWTAGFRSFVWFLAGIAGGIRNVKIGYYESFARIRGLTWMVLEPFHMPYQWSQGFIPMIFSLKNSVALRILGETSAPLECFPHLILWCLATRRCLMMALFEEMEVMLCGSEWRWRLSIGFEYLSIYIY